MTDICQREGVVRDQVTLHSDNGSPMKGATMLATLQQLGVIPSFSRPSVSNDNAYSESLFRTLKYRPEYPEHPFTNLQAADGAAQYAILHNKVSGLVFCYSHQSSDGHHLSPSGKRQDLTPYFNLAMGIIFHH